MDAVKNFVKVTVAAGYDSAATSILLAAGGGALLPAAPFNLIWWQSTDYPDPADDPNVEIVRVTAVVGDTLTVTRAQEGTAATAKNAAGKVYKMAQGVTKKILDDLAGGSGSHTHTLADITDAGTAAALNVPAAGNAAAGEVVKGDDTRLSDARTPTAHTHTLADITDAGTAAALNVAAAGDAAAGEVVKGDDTRLTLDDPDGPYLKWGEFEPPPGATIFQVAFATPFPAPPRYVHAMVEPPDYDSPFVFARARLRETNAFVVDLSSPTPDPATGWKVTWVAIL
ncbi:MAG: hypothetical protein D6781_00420 [Verrucomicrobia bacterium]|nr:MAG: hypothetical protein D6781_00420 [Verrucomicrobiota bacterium]